MTLNAWQEKLHLYFAGLRQQVVDSGSIRPIFALEHDLNEDEWRNLVDCLKDHIASSGPAGRHWLAWAVYAAEIGYSFKGDQYWQTFAADLPSWDRNGERDFVKYIFLRFRREFGGVEPAGAWADQFTNICWPIANAILPKDLQRHLASILYHVRDVFTASLIQDPDQLGSLIESRSEGTSKRFKQFASQHALVGRIASALLLSGSNAGSDLLLPHTLARITRDLQVEQNSRDWLNAAKQRASSVTFHGTRSQNSPKASTDSHCDRAFGQLGSTVAQAEILMRRTAEDSWSFRVLMPNLTSLTLGNEAFQRIVSTQRSFLSGAARSHFPPRFFLHAKREVDMKSLPKLGEQFMRFEDTADGFDSFLQSCCSFPKFTSLLFKVRAGDETTRLQAQVVRKNNRYLYVRPTPFRPSEILHSSHPVSVGCEGLSGLLIEVPEHPSSFYIEGARSLGLEVFHGVRVRPVAYPAQTWSGDGDVTWAESSPKLLNIQSDVESDGFVLSLLGPGTDHQLVCPASASGASLIDLSDLCVGEYQLKVTPRMPSTGDQYATGILNIIVLPKQEMVLDKERARGFTVLVTPSLPSLEQLWNGSAALDAYGPVGKTIASSLNFYSDTVSKQILLTVPGKELTLPITSNDWQSYLNSAKKSKQVLSAYEISASFSICFRSIELGQTLLHFEREFIPFRWLLREKNSSYRLRLIQNDTNETVNIDYFDFVAPNCPRPHVASAEGDIPVPKAGGMFAAKRGETITAIVAPPAPVHSLAALEAVVPRIPPPTTIEDILRLSEIIKLWTEAQLTGDFLARNRRDAAIRMLRVSLIEKMCGPKWVTYESDLEYSRLGIEGLFFRLGIEGGYRLASAAMNATSDLAEATPGDIASVALELASESHLRTRISHSLFSILIKRIICLQDVLRLDDRSVEPVPALDRECAEFAVQMTTLCRILRFLLLAKRRARDSCPTKVAAVRQ